MKENARVSDFDRIEESRERADGLAYEDWRDRVRAEDSDDREEWATDQERDAGTFFWHDDEREDDDADNE